MRLLSWIFRTLLFLAALGFALSNTRITELRFFGVDFVWSAPLVIFLLAFFAAGVVLGLLAVVPTLYRQRREIGRLRRELRGSGKPAGNVPPPPDVPSAAGSAETAARLGL